MESCTTEDPPRPPVTPREGRGRAYLRRSCTMPAFTILEAPMGFTRVPATAVLIALAAPTLVHAANLADAAECGIRGEMTGRVAAALADGTTTEARLHADAEKSGDRAVQRVNYAITQVRVLRQQGVTDPLASAARTASTCMVGK